MICDGAASFTYELDSCEMLKISGGEQRFKVFDLIRTSISVYKKEVLIFKQTFIVFCSFGDNLYRFFLQYVSCFIGFLSEGRWKVDVVIGIRYSRVS